MSLAVGCDVQATSPPNFAESRLILQRDDRADGLRTPDLTLSPRSRRSAAKAPQTRPAGVFSLRHAPLNRRKRSGGLFANVRFHRVLRSRRWRRSSRHPQRELLMSAGASAQSADVMAEVHHETGKRDSRKADRQGDLVVGRRLNQFRHGNLRRQVGKRASVRSPGFSRSFRLEPGMRTLIIFDLARLRPPAGNALVPHAGRFPRSPRVKTARSRSSN